MTLAFVMEKKQSSIKQTAAKIKTKLNNTSSFFKLSLKTNNKALALALAAQKQRTRQLETETVRLQKNAQSLNFDLAVQRHKNKQMFTILKAFYSTSVSCMAKAVDLISKEEVVTGLETEITEDACQAKGGVNEFLPESRDPSTRSKCLQTELVPAANTSMLNHHVHHFLAKSESKPSSPEKDHTMLPNVLQDSEMEITVVDNDAEIITVQTKPWKSSEAEQKRCGENNDTCLLKSRRSIMSSNGNAQMESELSGDMTVISPMEVYSEAQPQTNKNICASTCKSEEQDFQEPAETLYDEGELVTPRRKTHITSRNTKSNRRMCNTQKDSTGNQETKTYILPPLSSDLDDYFNDAEIQNKKRSKEISCDVKLFNNRGNNVDIAAHVKGSLNESPNHRKTYVFSRKSRVQKRSKTSQMRMSTEEISTPISDNINNDINVKEISVQVEKHQSKGATQSVSRTSEPSALKNRGTYVIHTSEASVHSDILNDVIGNASSEDTSNNVALDRDNESHHPVMREAHQEICSLQASFLKHSKTIGNDTLLAIAYDVPLKGHIVSKKASTHEVKKVREKKVATREKFSNSGKKRHLATESQVMVDISSVEENCTSSNELQKPTEVSHSSSPQGGFRGDSLSNTVNTDSDHLRNIDKGENMCTTKDLGTNLKDVTLIQNIQGHKRKCRETYIVSSSCNLKLKGNTEDSQVTNKDSKISSVTNRTVVPHHSISRQLIPQNAEELKERLSAFLNEERPPWQSFGSTDDDIFDTPVNTCRPSPKISTQTMNIYEDPGSDVTYPSPDGKAAKTLTNPDLTANASDRTRRKAATVSYKEPPLNCKMRRGDKFSDGRFLHSPVFKGDKKKRVKKNKD